MLKSKFLHWLVIAVVIAGGVAVIVKTGSIDLFSNRHNVNPLSPTGGGDFSARPNVPAPPPPGTLAAPDLQAISRYPAGPDYKGRLGDFWVAPGEFPAGPPHLQPCKSSQEDAGVSTQSPKTSELYSPVFGDRPEVVECGGKIVHIGVAPKAGRQYFVGPAKVPWRCPFDRFKLLTVGGHPAIAQDPACRGGLRLVVIERFPSGDEPGILLGVDSLGRSLEETVTLAAQIMGVRP